MPETQFYTLEELSKMLKVSLAAIMREVRTGELEVGGRRDRRGYYVTEEQLSAFFEKKRIRPNKEHTTVWPRARSPDS